MSTERYKTPQIYDLPFIMSEADSCFGHPDTLIARSSGLLYFQTVLSDDLQKLYAQQNPYVHGEAEFIHHTNPLERQFAGVKYTPTHTVHVLFDEYDKADDNTVETEINLCTDGTYFEKIIAGGVTAQIRKDAQVNSNWKLLLASIRGDTQALSVPDVKTIKDLIEDNCDPQNPEYSEVRTRFFLNGQAELMQRKYPNGARQTLEFSVRQHDPAGEYDKEWLFKKNDNRYEVVFATSRSDEPVELTEEHFIEYHRWFGLCVPSRN